MMTPRPFGGGWQNIVTPYKTFFNVELKNNDVVLEIFD